MAAKMDAAFQFARTNTLTWSFITQFFPNFIYGLLSSNYSSCQYGFCLMNETQDSKTDIPFPLQGIMQGPVSESHCSSFRITFSKKISGILSKCQNSLDPDQDQHSVGPDLGPNCLQRLSADDKSGC